MNIHIFTGGKGGTGKTLLSICASLYYINLRKLLIVDFNIFNPDLHYVLGRARLEGEEKSQEGGFVFTKLPREGHLVMPDPNNNEPYMLPKYGIASFYNDLNRVIDISIRKGYLNNDSNDYIIVDTGFHIANLFMDLPDNQENRDLSNNENGENNWLMPDKGGYKVPNRLQNARLIIWFLWTLTALEREGEVDMIRRVVRNLNRYNIGRFDEVEDFQHVFNPFTLYPPESGFGFIEKWFSDSYKQFINDTIGSNNAPEEGMPLAVMIFDVRNALKDVADRDVSSEKYPSELIDKIKETCGGRPRNFFPMLNYIDLRGYTDKWANRESLNIEEIRRELRKPHELMKNYLKNLGAKR